MFSNKYMYKNRLNELSKDSIARNCKAFGYMDGYLDEEIYSSIFEYNDNNNANYEKGYIEGVNARLKEDSDVFLMQKSEHIIKLAMYDGESGIAPRKISRNYKDIPLRESLIDKETNHLSFSKLALARLAFLLISPS